jgi:hypothetical protein
MAAAAPVNLPLLLQQAILVDSGGVMVAGHLMGARKASRGRAS